MNKEQLQIWALVAEIVGGLAVVLSLIFVGLEVRQSSEETALNTRAVEANAYQDLINQINALNLARLANPDMLEIIPTIGEDYNPQTPVEVGYLFTTYIYVVRHGEMAYFQYKQGLIDEGMSLSALAILRGVLSTNWGQGYWQGFADSRINTPYSEYVQAMMKERLPDDPYWQSQQ